MQILNLNVKYWQCHQHPQTHQYDMMLLNLQNADCSPPHGLTSTTAACRVDQHLSKYIINSDPSIDGDRVPLIVALPPILTSLRTISS